MADSIQRIADGFWNIRGTYRIFVLLDAYTLSGDVAETVRGLTAGGRSIDAVLNLHPFHTMHVEAIAGMFPDARQYGTARHHARFPGVQWAPERTETEAFAALFADDFDLSVPAGVDFIPSDEALHFASVLAFHRASATLHVDDTLNWLPFPLGNRLAFHPTLGKVLERRAGAVDDFRAWAQALITRCEAVRHVCTAHTRLAPVSDDPPGGVADRVRMALEKVESTLASHAKRYG